MTLIQSTAFRHALRLQLKHISHPAVAFVSKVSVGRRRRRDRWRHHELNRARRRACVALARHRRGPLAEDIEGSIVGAAEGRALQPRQGEGTGVQLAPRELQGCVLRPRSKWVKEWLRVGRKGGKAASLRGWGGRSPLTEVLAELVGGAFARDEDDPAEGGVAPH